MPSFGIFLLLHRHYFYVMLGKCFHFCWSKNIILKTSRWWWYFENKNSMYFLFPFRCCSLSNILWIIGLGLGKEWEKSKITHKEGGNGEEMLLFHRDRKFFWFWEKDPRKEKAVEEIRHQCPYFFPRWWLNLKRWRCIRKKIPHSLMDDAKKSGAQVLPPTQDSGEKAHQAPLQAHNTHRMFQKITQV